MSRDTIMKDEEGKVYSYDNLRTQGYLDGHAPGVDACVKYLEDKAAELFMAGKDEGAKNLRNMAREMGTKLKTEMEARAKRHAEDYPDDITGL